MDRENLESLDEESLFRIQNTISEIIKERNFKKGDIEAIVELRKTGLGSQATWSTMLLEEINHQNVSNSNQ